MTDRAMPDVNGDKLANAIKLAAPATPVIMLTGFGDMMEADDERSENVDLILRKPVALLLLRKALVEVTAQ
jgi:FixJ family two-component response regulator